MSDRQGTAGRAVARLVYADRRQVLLRPCDLESLLPEDHRARVVWGSCRSLDLTAFHAQVGSRGRPAFDPAVLLTLFALAHNVMRAVAPRYRFSLIDFLPRLEAEVPSLQARQKVN